MSHRLHADRLRYQRVYYTRNAERICTNNRHRQQMQYWCFWLLANLEWPEELTPVYPKSYPIRRPLLRLPKPIEVRP